MLIGTIPLAAAHTTVSVEEYTIEIGWGIEPPINGLRNEIVIEVAKPGDVKGVSTGVKGAFKDMSAVVVFGGERKMLDIGAESRPGHYFSPIIPTKIGSYSVEVSGTLEGVDVQVDIPIEDVEGTAVLDFPVQTLVDQDVSNLESAMSAMQQQIREISSNKQQSESDDDVYGLSIFGISFGISGVILAVIAMIRRK